MGRKGVKKQFWLSREQAALLEKSAKSACMAEVQLIRLLIAGYQPPCAPDEKFYEEMDELLKVSGELVALSKRLKYGEAAELILGEGRELRRLRKELERKYLGGERGGLKWQ